MDDFTADLVNTAYDRAKAAGRRRAGKVPLRELRHWIDRAWADWRNETIAAWAARIHAHAAHDKLAGLVPVLERWLSREPYYLYGWEPDDGAGFDLTWWTAWVLATMRWIHRERAGAVPLPDYTDDDLRGWLLEHREPEQLRLPLFEA